MNALLVRCLGYLFLLDASRLKAAAVALERLFMEQRVGKGRTR